jgi:hypothetical protein
MPRRQTRRYQGITRNAKGFRRVTVPHPAGDPPPNSPYWQRKLESAMLELTCKPEWRAVWDSDLVPDHSTFRHHYELAIQIILGKLTLDDLKKQSPA